jgi:hypothetical protein
LILLLALRLRHCHTLPLLITPLLLPRHIIDYWYYCHAAIRRWLLMPLRYFFISHYAFTPIHAHYCYYIDDWYIITTLLYCWLLDAIITIITPLFTLIFTFIIDLRILPLDYNNIFDWHAIIFTFRHWHYIFIIITYIHNWIDIHTLFNRHIISYIWWYLAEYTSLLCHWYWL